jgi:Zn finger protein HypA/HybF involved in hydrogenase expression
MCLPVTVSDSNAAHMTAPAAWSTPLVAECQTVNTCVHTHTHIYNIHCHKCKDLSLNIDDKTELLRPSHTAVQLTAPTYVHNAINKSSE